MEFKAIATVVGLIGTSFAAFFFMDTRHVQANDFEDLKWSVQVRQISEVKDEVGFAERAGDLERVVRKQTELEMLVKNFCHQYPDDIECD